ncbi:MAG: hypothetical protein KatS3mg057_1015 [Herpetosiphonaceae bacterium]|nr:MAG: hypothetical protein KatS3mg057_1015 [Herpetosiphonaceae bacterium]
MAQKIDDFDVQLRLLECWLPLVEEIRRQQGWQESIQDLERLIMRAAAALQRARSGEEAYQIICAYHQQLERKTPWHDDREESSAARG